MFLKSVLILCILFFNHQQIFCQIATISELKEVTHANFDNLLPVLPNKTRKVLPRKQNNRLRIRMSLFLKCTGILISVYRKLMVLFNLIRAFILKKGSSHFISNAELIAFSRTSESLHFYLEKRRIEFIPLSISFLPPRGRCQSPVTPQKVEIKGKTFLFKIK